MLRLIMGRRKRRVKASRLVLFLSWLISLTDDVWVLVLLFLWLLRAVSGFDYWFAVILFLMAV